MRLSEDYLLREIYGEYALIPCGQAIVEQRKVLRLNKTGYEIAKRLLCEIVYTE